MPSILQYSKELGRVLPVFTCGNGEYSFHNRECFKFIIICHVLQQITHGMH